MNFSLHTHSCKSEIIRMKDVHTCGHSQHESSAYLYNIIKTLTLMCFKTPIAKRESKLQSNPLAGGGQLYFAGSP